MQVQARRFVDNRLVSGCGSAKTHSAANRRYSLQTLPFVCTARPVRGRVRWHRGVDSRSPSLSSSTLLIAPVCKCSSAMALVCIAKLDARAQTRKRGCCPKAVSSRGVWLDERIKRRSQDKQARSDWCDVSSVLLLPQFAPGEQLVTVTNTPWTRSHHDCVHVSPTGSPHCDAVRGVYFRDLRSHHDSVTSALC